MFVRRFILFLTSAQPLLCNNVNVLTFCQYCVCLFRVVSPPPHICQHGRSPFYKMLNGSLQHFKDYQYAFPFDSTSVSILRSAQKTRPKWSPNFLVCDSKKQCSFHLQSLLTEVMHSKYSFEVHCLSTFVPHIISEWCRHILTQIHLCDGFGFFFLNKLAK